MSGSGPGSAISDRKTYRNGYRVREWDTRVGTLQLEARQILPEVELRMDDATRMVIDERVKVTEPRFIGARRIRDRKALRPVALPGAVATGLLVSRKGTALALEVLLGGVASTKVVGQGRFDDLRELGAICSRFAHEQLDQGRGRATRLLAPKSDCPIDNGFIQHARLPQVKSPCARMG